MYEYFLQPHMEYCILHVFVSFDLRDEVGYVLYHNHFGGLFIFFIFGCLLFVSFLVRFLFDRIRFPRILL